MNWKYIGGFIIGAVSFESLLRIIQKIMDILRISYDVEVSFFVALGLLLIFPLAIVSIAGVIVRRYTRTHVSFGRGLPSGSTFIFFLKMLSFLGLIRIW